jgi:hypothetical protein
MAPRPLETRDAFLARLRRAPETPVYFGGHHFSHAVVHEDGKWRVRPLVLDKAKADAYLAERGHFMPENAEALSEPGDPVALEADSREALIAAIAAGAFTLWSW